MCLDLSVCAAEAARPLLEEVSRSLSAGALRLEVRPPSRGSEPEQVCAALSEDGACACSLLSEDADWNEAFWSMRPEVLEPLAQTLAAVVASRPGEVTVAALWNGDEPRAELRVSPADLVSLARAGRLGTRTRYRVVEVP